jgi:hypothetical protein
MAVIPALEHSMMTESYKISHPPAVAPPAPCVPQFEAPKFKIGDHVHLIKECEWSKKDNLTLGDTYKVSYADHSTLTLDGKTFTYDSDQYVLATSQVPRCDEELSNFKECISLVESGQLPSDSDLGNLNDSHMQDFYAISLFSEDELVSLKDEALTCTNDESYDPDFRKFCDYLLRVIQWHFEDK